MSVLILTCDTGEGHNSCAKAIQEVYDAHGMTCEIVNPVQFVAPWFARFVHWLHNFMYQKHTKIFKAGYVFTEQYPNLTTRKGSFPYWVLSKGVDKLHNYMVEHQLTDIICVHPLLMMMVTELQKRYGVSGQVAFVATDYTCSPGVKDGDPEYCFIPDPSLRGSFYCETIESPEIIASGIPVRQQFYTHEDSKTAKMHFGIPEEALHLVIMCGSMGCGAMGDIVDHLDKDGSFHVTVICGTNESLREQMSEKYSGYDTIHIRGYVNEMSLLMDSADLFVTKPGGLSSTEIAVKCLPTVYMNAVGGCESYNMEFFVRNNCAMEAYSPEHAAILCQDLLRTPELRGYMRQALQELKTGNAAEVIYRTLQGERS